MWFGDETWTMLTVRALASTGVACVPEALGSSLAHSNGFVNGSIWLSGIIYGIPANVFASIASPVEIGRVITLMLSLVMLFVVYRVAFTITVSPLSSAFGVFLLVLTNAFYFSSHSARLDLITGLAVILYVLLLIRAYNASHNPSGSSMTRWSFILSFLSVLSLAVYVHVPTLILLPALYTLWVTGAFRSVRGWAAMALGSASAMLLLLVPYYLTNGSITLLGHGYNQYYNVANSLPILHPFSWQVQKINTIDRAIQLWQVAWPLVSVLVIAIAAHFGLRQRFSSKASFLLSISFLAIVSWMLAEGPAVFYNIHILPVLSVAAAVVITQILERYSQSSTFQWSVALIALALFIAVNISQHRMGEIGSRITSENHEAVHALIDPIISTSYSSLVLTDQPALDEIAGTHGVRLMTNHLLLFGEENKPLPNILREKGVDYLLLYSTVKWQSPFRPIADSLYTLVGQRIGILTDQARNYDELNANEKDTLRLYKAR